MKKLDLYSQFRAQHENNGRYQAEWLAKKAARLTIQWWGEGLVLLGIRKDEQGYCPVFDVCNN